MSRIRYFRTCSLLEGAVADAALQLVAQIHDRSPAAASRLLTELMGEPVEVGIEVSSSPSADDQGPDGLILQRSFRVVVDARVDSTVSLDQMLRHAGSFRSEQKKFLLLLTKQPVVHQERMIVTLLEGSHPDVLFRNVTYSGICRAMRDLAMDREPLFAELLRDFEEYCGELGLLGPSGTILRIIPCGRTYEMNKKHGVWFQSADRGLDPQGLIGIYAGRKVRALLDVHSVFEVELVDGVVDKRLIRGENTERFDTALRQIIEEAGVSLGLNIAQGYRFYCGDAFATEFRKSSPGELADTRLVDLNEVLGSVVDAADAASRLAGKKWS